MSVHVETVETEVVTEPRAPEAPAPPTPPWREVERVRSAQARVLRDRLRTRAEGYDA